jgi:hypothetical protein
MSKELPGLIGIVAASPDWVKVVDGLETCNGCEKPLGVGLAIRVGNPPPTMTLSERDYLFHDGGCVSEWAKLEERSAIERALVYPENIVTRQRGVEMRQLAAEARNWRR